MSSRGGTVTLVYDSPISFSGQYAATALIRDTLADSDWTFQAVEYPALDRTAGKVTRYASYLAKTARCWAALALRATPGTILHINLPQSPVAFAKMGWPLRLIESVRSGVPVVVSLHGSVFMSWERDQSEAQAFLRILRAADVVTVLGPVQRARLVEWGIEADRVRIVENTSELTPASDHAVRAKQHATEEEPVRLLHLSLLVESKGYPEYLEALGILGTRDLGRRVEAVLCGPPSFTSFCTRFTTVESKAAWIEERLAAINASDSVSATWIPGARGEAKEALFENAQVFVFPSQFPVEAQPLVLLEAMASGCALISSTVGEIPSTLGEGTALLLDETTPVAIADAIERLVRDADLRASLAQAGLDRVRTTFSLDRYASTWDEIFSSLLPASA